MTTHVASTYIITRKVDVKEKHLQKFCNEYNIIDFIFCIDGDHDSYVCHLLRQ